LPALFWDMLPRIRSEQAPASRPNKLNHGESMPAQISDMEYACLRNLGRASGVCNVVVILRKNWCQCLPSRTACETAGAPREQPAPRQETEDETGATDQVERAAAAPLKRSAAHAQSLWPHRLSRFSERMTQLPVRIAVYLDICSGMHRS
jgi:hypothetical protein